MLFYLAIVLSVLAIAALGAPLVRLGIAAVFRPRPDRDPVADDPRRDREVEDVVRELLYGEEARGVGLSPPVTWVPPPAPGRTHRDPAGGAPPVPGRAT